MVVGPRQDSRQALLNTTRTTSPSRRDILIVAAGSTLAAALPLPAFAQVAANEERHGMSAFGDLKYSADFKQFDYVNPNAPKGGAFSQIGPVRQYNQGLLTFNTLNSYVLKGDAAQGMELTFATLMARAGDEPDAMYGYVAKGVTISADGLTYRFTLRPEARFHDGTKLTAHDAAFTTALLKDKGHPIIGQLLRDLIDAKAEDDAT
ncbi:MAG: ABC transporter substrate-binding protein, partial [Hyphomicrobiales bacterium]